MTVSDRSRPSADVVLTERRRDTMIVTLNRPERLNALSPAVCQQLAGALHAAAQPDVRAVVLTGAGRGFCAGVDLKPDPAQLLDPVRSRLRYEFSPIVLQITGLGKPVVAAVNGAAAGAGLGLACAADLRIASTEATFVPAFSKSGNVPDMGTSYHLPRIIGYERSLQWLLRGEPMTAPQAEQVGLVQGIVEGPEVVEAAVGLCESLTSTTPTAVRLTKRLLRESFRSTLAEQLEREATYQPIAAEDPGRAAARRLVLDSLQKKPSS